MAEEEVDEKEEQAEKGGEGKKEGKALTDTMKIQTRSSPS